MGKAPMGIGGKVLGSSDKNLFGRGEGGVDWDLFNEPGLPYRNCYIHTIIKGRLSPNHVFKRPQHIQLLYTVALVIDRNGFTLRKELSMRIKMEKSLL
ncbi:hypothetical protein TNCV_1715261 [Trichonephila clavipes]|nr:hypothetical protein TNCV_1715261 [Trichonephila clavipes]